MAHVIPFDTLAFVKELESAGVPTAQAEAQAKALSSVLQKVEDVRAGELATKRDMKELEGQLATKADVAKVELQILELKRDLKEMEGRTDTKLSEAKLDIIKWVIGTSGIVVALMKLLPGGH